MNARRHTLDGNRTKLATGVLTYRQIELACLPARDRKISSGQIGALGNGS